MSNKDTLAPVHLRFKRSLQNTNVVPLGFRQLVQSWTKKMRTEKLDDQSLNFLPRLCTIAVALLITNNDLSYEQLLIELQLFRCL